MVNIQNIQGINKYFLNIRIKISVLYYFLKFILHKKITVNLFIRILKRLNYFLSTLQHNKFVKIGNKTRLGLYIPGYPSNAFYTACRKFAVFNEKLPNTTVLLSITKACRFDCPHCYQKNDLGKDMDINTLINAVKILQDSGTAFFNIEGGEPFLVYDRLKKVCESIDSRSEIWINSTGDAMDLDKLNGLKKLNVTAIMFSLHSPYPEKLNEFMRSEIAWETMRNGIALCHKADIPVALNTCLPKEDFYNGNFQKLMDIARDLNASIIQIIKPKSTGGWLNTDVSHFSQDDLDHVKKTVNLYNNDKKYKSYPSISAQIIEEDENMFGCTAGGTDRFYINAKGDVQPCEFLNISFGNIQEENFETIYKRMRNVFNEPCECWVCETYCKEILKIKNENNIKSLPLDTILSEQIYKNWNRGRSTKLYKKIESF
ncbi:MAG: radical SAM protein [Candidatus Aureabacteria bacterium]|nr:radical SAM protein [Candidatus Auribacterota bacterium]